jgi:putative ABC transport system ATP-binding protein
VTELRQQAYSTVIYFSNRRIDLGFDRFLYLEADRQRFFDSFEDFRNAMNPPGLNSDASLPKGGA